MTPVTAGQAARALSAYNGQGFVRCNCRAQGRCTDNRCSCKKAGLLCNSKCHSSADCANKHDAEDS
ncbi:unnamed protein product [Heterosigma akashiwo]